MIKSEKPETVSHLEIVSSDINGEWSCGAKVLGKLLVPGGPTNVDTSTCGWGLCGHFFL